MVTALEYLEDDLSESGVASSSCLSFGLEWTQEQHLENITAAGRKSRRGFGSLMPKLLGGVSGSSSNSNHHQHQHHHNQHSHNNKSGNDSLSLGSDAAVQSVGSVVSAANFTVGSTDTVKASNTAAPNKSQGTEDGVLKKRWGKIKNAFGLRVAPDQQQQQQQQSAAAAGAKPLHFNRGHSYSADYATSNRSSSKGIEALASATKSLSCRPRLGSTEQQQSNNNRRVRSNPSEQRVKQYIHDQSVTCRFDGLDVISLGPARYETSPLAPLDSELSLADDTRKPGPWQLSPVIPYTPIGTRTMLSPGQMITNMLWTSSGSELPEIILEGFVPGADDRWSVRVEQREVTAPSSRPSCLCGDSSAACVTAEPLPNIYNSPLSQRRPVGSSSQPPGLVPAHSGSEDCETSEELSTSMIPTVHLWSTLWGENPPPHATLEAVQDDDPLLTLAAENSIPIDLDENTFCVSERSHLETIHSFVSVSLSMGRFETALRILKKLLKGIELMKDRIQSDQTGLQFLKGSTLHNLGVIYMWQGDFESALAHFHGAVQERQRTLPREHPDIAVSMAREAMMQFAVGRFEEALFGMELALPLTHEKSMLRSKILNNMGAMHFMKRDLVSALKKFTTALEIQRLLLDGEVRRDAIVYDAATTLGNMGKLYLERDDYQLSYYVYEEALLLLTTIFRKDHDLVLSSLTSLALIRAWDGQIKSALLILQGCLRSQTARFGKDSAQSIETIATMGALYENVDCLDDALKCFLLVKHWQKENLPSDHPSRRQMRGVLVKTQERLGKNVSMWV